MTRYEAELNALRMLAESVRDHERDPCGGNVTRMRDALRTVDAAQGRKPGEWDGTGKKCLWCKGSMEAHVTGSDCPYDGLLEVD